MYVWIQRWSRRNCHIFQIIFSHWNIFFWSLKIYFFPWNLYIFCVALHSHLAFAKACHQSSNYIHRLNREIDYRQTKSWIRNLLRCSLVFSLMGFDCGRWVIVGFSNRRRGNRSRQIRKNKNNQFNILLCIYAGCVEKDKIRWSIFEKRCRDQWLVTRMTGVRIPEEDEGVSSLPPPVFHPRCGQLVSLSQGNRTASRSHATQVKSLTSLCWTGLEVFIYLCWDEAMRMWC